MNWISRIALSLRDHVFREYSQRITSHSRRIETLINYLRYGGCLLIPGSLGTLEIQPPQSRRGICAADAIRLGAITRITWTAGTLGDGECCHCGWIRLDTVTGSYCYLLGLWHSHCHCRLCLGHSWFNPNFNETDNKREKIHINKVIKFWIML